MTPLEQAQQRQKKGCDTCAKRVVLRPHGASYCKVSGKLLLSSLLDVGQCVHIPSEYEPKGDDMETRENELHVPTVKYYKETKKYKSFAEIICCVCGRTVAQDGEITKEKANDMIPNYCKFCGARLKEIEE